MVTTIQIPDEYGYVLFSIVTTFLTGTFLGSRVTSFRKLAGIPYPFEYASWEQVQSATPERKKAMITFNAAQRGHQNFNENHLATVGSLLVIGLQQPKGAAVAGIVWSVGRILYGIGYTRNTENGKGRFLGAPGMLIQYGAQIWAAVVGWKLAFN